MVNYIIACRQHILQLETIMSDLNIKFPPKPSTPKELSPYIQDPEPPITEQIPSIPSVPETPTTIIPTLVSPPLPPRDDDDEIMPTKLTFITKQEPLNKGPLQNPIRNSDTDLSKYKLVVYDTTIPLPAPLPDSIQLTQSLIRSYVSKPNAYYYKV